MKDASHVCCHNSESSLYQKQGCGRAKFSTASASASIFNSQRPRQRQRPTQPRPLKILPRPEVRKYLVLIYKVSILLKIDFARYVVEGSEIYSIFKFYEEVKNSDLMIFCQLCYSISIEITASTTASNQNL